MIRSAEKDLAIAELIAGGACAVVPLLLFCNADTILQNGFKISSTTVLKGIPAKVVAIMLELAGIGVIAVGFLVLPDFEF